MTSGAGYADVAANRLRSVRKIEFCRYTLKPRAAGLKSRSGALLRVGFSDLAAPGVSDLFPWETFGDPSLDSWLEQLKTSFSKNSVEVLMSPNESAPQLAKVSPTVAKSLLAARDEAEAVSAGRSLVPGSIVNHWLATDPMDLAVHDILEARRSSSPAIKVKIGHRSPENEAAALSRLNSHWGLKLRLDANERMTRESLMTFLDGLPIRIRQSIEFIEDPFPFDVKSWREFYRETGIAVAYDRGTAQSSLAEVFSADAAQVLIHKPAWQDDDRVHLAKSLQIPVVVTSILGHPVGNLWAASKALELAPEGVHGCRSHVAYRDDEASLTLVKSKQVKGSRVVGLGVGLGLQSKWWNRLKWETLA